VTDHYDGRTLIAVPNDVADDARSHSSPTDPIHQE